MYTKKDYTTALLKLGFIQDDNTKTCGSHIRYYHSIYPNIYAGIDDHKNTKEMNQNICMELIRTMLLIVFLECRKENGEIDYKKAKSMLKEIDKSMASELLTRLKKLNGKSMLLSIVPKRLATEVSKAKKKLTEESILSYIEKLRD